ncbi:MAG: GAF domain-containing protein [Elusimicrobia bacterium]|nr:GAF domain-containing protein [Elusimicrobiota bacterium]
MKPLQITHAFSAVHGKIQNKSSLNSKFTKDFEIELTLHKLLDLSICAKTIEDFFKRSLIEIGKLKWMRKDSKCSIHLFDPNQKNLILTAHKNLSSHEIENCSSVPIPFSLESEFKKQGIKTDGRLFNEISKHFAANKKVQTNRYMIGIKRGDKILGIIYVKTKNDLNKDKSIKKFMAAFINLAAETIARKENEIALLTEKTESSSIAELSNIYLSADKISINDILDMVLRKAQEITKSKYGFVGHIDSNTGHMIIPTLTKEIWHKCRVEGKSIIFKKFGDLWGWKKPILSNDIENDSRSRGMPKGHIKIKNFLSAPAIFNNKLIGIVSVANAKKDYTQTDLAYIKRLADFCAIAFHRKIEEDKIKENEKMLQTIFNTATDMILIKDTNHKFIKVNNACADFFNIPAKKMIGKTNYDIFPKEMAKKITDEEEIVLKQGKTLTTDTIRKTPNGTKTINAIKTPIKNKKGEITGLLAIIRDITELRKLQEELIHRQAIEEAEKITGGVAHDFNNVLAAINGYSTLMLENLGYKNPARMEIEAIKKAVERAAAITNRLQNTPKSEN